MLYEHMSLRGLYARLVNARVKLSFKQAGMPPKRIKRKLDSYSLIMIEQHFIKEERQLYFYKHHRVLVRLRSFHNFCPLSFRPLVPFLLEVRFEGRHVLHDRITAPTN